MAEDFEAWLAAAQAWVAQHLGAAEAAQRWTVPDDLRRGAVLNLDGARVVGHFVAWPNGHHEALLLATASGNARYADAGQAPIESERWAALRRALWVFLAEEAGAPPGG